MAGDLALQAVDDLVQRGLHVATHRPGPEGLSGRVTGHFHPMARADPRVPLEGHLDLAPDDLRIQPLDLGQLVLGRSTDLVGDPNAPALHDQIHPPSSPRRAYPCPRGPPWRRGPAWLTWSLAPHSPAEG